jgi:beta-N-acetylhexosaminidase
MGVGMQTVRPGRIVPAAALAVAVASFGVTAATAAARPSVHASADSHAAGTTSTSPPTASCSTALVAVGGRQALDSWSVSRLAEQTLVVPVDESDVGAAHAEVAAGAGGIILFGSSAPSDLIGSIAALDAAAPSGLAPIVMTDEEGGAVQRMANLVGSIPSARQMGRTMTPAAIERLAEGLGKRLLAAGVTMDLAPVLDIDGGAGPNSKDADGTRSFSSEEPVAARDGLAFATGLERAGIVPVVKHFPGLGGATANTDLASASTPPWLLEQRIGLVPFARAVAEHIPAVLVSNAKVPGLTNLPASISKSVVSGVLRERLHFRGLVLTDSLSAQSVRDAGYDVPRAAVAALEAGSDMVLFNMTSSTAALTSSTADAIVQAVHSRSLARSRLVDAAAHVLAVKPSPNCS